MQGTKKTLTEVDFLKYYFQDLCKQKKIPLNYYQDPLVQKYRKRKSRVKDEKRPKSINIYYLTLVFECPEFVSDFFEYIEGQLMEHCMLEIPDKFQLIFRNYLKKNGNSGQVKNYFESNKRCKLPWSFNDVKIAIKAMKFVLSDIKKGIFAEK
jgi:predicted nuclease of restriction endonuclease-like (RecB) superfamily